MLSEHEKSLMRRCLALLREGMLGFTTRHAQLAMMAEVANTLGAIPAEEEEVVHPAAIAVVEAGTGTGKTLGYLLPAIVLAHLRGLKLVVSSSTVALQEQLMGKDIPALQAHLPFNFNCVLAKGRRRYVCPAKLLGMASQRHVDALPGEEGQDTKPIRQTVASRGSTEGELAEAFRNGGWGGDRDDWPQAIEDAVWQRVSTEAGGCMGSACHEYERCPFYAARQRLNEANLIVANHDLVLAAMEMEAGALLPDPAQTLFVMDEAHNLPSKAAKRSARRHSVLGSMRWITDLVNLAEEARGGLKLDEKVVQAVVGEGHHLAELLMALRDVLRQSSWPKDDGDAVIRLVHGVVPDDMAEVGGQTLEAAKRLQDALEAMRDALMDRSRNGAEIVQPYIAVVGTCLSHVGKLIGTWDRMLAPMLPGQKPVARWLERGRRHGREVDFHVCAVPICGGPRLEELLWSRVGAAVLTSATLQACGSFDLFLEESGLLERQEVKLVSLPSPFDYPNRAELHLPSIRHHPRKSEEHSEEVAALLPDLVSGHLGVLVLFASARQMHRVAELVPDWLREAVLVQGSMSKRELLQCHRAKIDEGQPSVLFGLASLSEGVDLPGDYCTHVVVVKLPFAVPGEPREEARREWIEAQGRSAFHERSVPEVGIRLAQAVGRLLRTFEDHGVVTVLDPRLGSTGWGRRLLRSLPPFRIVRGPMLKEKRA